MLSFVRLGPYEYLLGGQPGLPDVRMQLQVTAKLGVKIELGRQWIPGPCRLLTGYPYQSTRQRRFDSLLLQDYIPIRHASSPSPQTVNALCVESPTLCLLQSAQYTQLNPAVGVRGFDKFDDTV